MIKATKEILRNIGIENLFLSGSHESEKWLFQPIEMESSYWICSLNTPCFLANVICNIKINFFIYCCHDLFLPFLKSVIAVDENNEFWRYLIVVGADLILCLLLYKIVVWVFPKTSKYLTGGR